MPYFYEDAVPVEPLKPRDFWYLDRRFFLQIAQRIRMHSSGVRTTLILNDSLASEARKRAAERGASVSAIVNKALLKAFRTPSGPDRPQDFKMPTYAPQEATTRHLSPQEMDRYEAEGLRFEHWVPDPG